MLRQRSGPNVPALSPTLAPPPRRCANTVGSMARSAIVAVARSANRKVDRRRTMDTGSLRNRMKERGLECYHRGLTARPGANIFAVREKNRPLRVHRFVMTRLTNANLTRREAQIMEILHRHRRATVEEI